MMSVGDDGLSRRRKRRCCTELASQAQAQQSGWPMRVFGFSLVNACHAELNLEISDDAFTKQYAFLGE
jgi:hypothetical protein